MRMPSILLGWVLAVAMALGIPKNGVPGRPGLLVDAARSGNVVALDGLLQEGDGGAHVNLQTEGGVSLIMHAIIARLVRGEGAYFVLK